MQEFAKLILPEIPEDAKQSVVSEMKEGAEPSIDYSSMVVLSAVIATFGLSVNSVAIIIGAMVIAPLMAPILAMSLATVKGDINFFHRALESEAKGIAIGIAVSFAATLLIPNLTLTPEILARTQPTLIDLGVALVSGLAGAYAICRRMNTALPGVAIATATMPPLSVVGIGIAMRDWQVAGGGFLLFAANLIAINLAGSLVFWVFGFSPKVSTQSQNSAKKQIATSAALLLLVSIPLGWIMFTGISDQDTKSVIDEVLDFQVRDSMKGIVLESSYGYSFDGVLTVHAAISSPSSFTQQKSDEIRNALESRLGRPVNLDIKHSRLDSFSSAHTQG